MWCLSKEYCYQLFSDDVHKTFSVFIDEFAQQAALQFLSPGGLTERKQGVFYDSRLHKTSILCSSHSLRTTIRSSNLSSTIVGMSVRALLLSNSTQHGRKYLELWSSTIESFVAKFQAKKAIFVPFAGITIDWDVYTSNVATALPFLDIQGIHKQSDMIAAVNTAEIIMIGGGNTFNLLLNLQKNNLLDVIRSRVKEGIPYIGWSAGSNVATPDIGTTNDMPVVWPLAQEALSLVPFNVNPHYQNWKPPGFQGEGRDDRLNEAILVKKRDIIALSEGMAILAEGDDASSVKYTLLKSPKSERPPDSVLQVRIWKPSQDDKGYKVVDIDLGQNEDPVPLNPYLH